jgi:hypothetical protein
MICSKDEFLLHLSNWMTASQSVVVAILLVNPEGSSSTTIARLRGYVQCVESDFFVVGKHPGSNPRDTVSDDFIKVELDGWEFSYADPLERPAMADGLVGISLPVVEGVSLSDSANIQISVFSVG